MEKLLPAKTRAVKALVEKGILSAETVKNPVTGWMQPIVRPDKLARFKSEFVSLHVLSKERGEHFRRVKKALVAAGVQPVADPELLGQTLYRRAELPFACRCDPMNVGTVATGTTEPVRKSCGRICY